MQKSFGAGLACELSHTFGRADVHRSEGVSSALYVEADSIHHAECIGDGCGD